MADQWLCPYFTIGDAAMMEQNIAWAMIPGATPYITNFVVPVGQLNDALLAVQNPTTLRLYCTGGTTGSPDTKSLVISNIYLLQPKNIDPYMVQWSVADIRWGWRGKKLYCKYNKTRQANDKILATNPPDTDPAILRQQYSSFSAGRYVPWSVKDGVPWTVKEILEAELVKLGISVAAIQTEDKSYIVENIEMDGIDIYAGITELLSKSRMNLGILTNGDVYPYSLDFFDETPIEGVLHTQNLCKTGPGILYRQDQKRVRPTKINVRFEKLQEVRVISKSSVDTPSGQAITISARPPTVLPQDIVERRAIACENVISVPYPVTSAGVTYNIGEYLPMWKYLSIIGLTELELQQHWFATRLERRVSELFRVQAGSGLTAIIDAQAANVASALRHNYRQTYQIDPFMADRMKTWMNRRVKIIDNYSHFQPPSPLWSDFCIVPKRRHPYVAKGLGLWATHAYNWYANTYDEFRQRPTAGTIDIVSQQLGVFRVSFPGLIDRTLEEIIPSAVENLPGGYAGSGNAFWEQAYLASTHTLETIISVVWDLDYQDQYDSTRKFWQISIPGSIAGITEGPEIDFLSRQDYAREGIREDTAPLFGGGIVAGAIPRIENQNILSAVANAEAAKLLNQQRDRIVGQVKVAGIPEGLKLLGNIKAIVYQFSPKAGLETIIDARDIPPDPSIEQQVPADVLAYLKKQVYKSRTGTNA